MAGLFNITTAAPRIDEEQPEGFDTSPIMASADPVPSAPASPPPDQTPTAPTPRGFRVVGVEQPPAPSSSPAENGQSDEAPPPAPVQPPKGFRVSGVEQYQPALAQLQDLEYAQSQNAPAEVKRPSVLDRFKAHVGEGFNTGTLAGAASNTMPGDEPSAAAQRYSLDMDPAATAERRTQDVVAEARRHAAFESMPDAQGPADYAAAIGGELVGGAPSPENLITPDLSSVYKGIRTAVPVLGKFGARVITRGAEQVVPNVVTDPMIQRMREGAGLQGDYDPTQTAMGAATGFGIGAGATTLNRIGKRIARGMRRGASDDVPEVDVPPPPDDTGPGGAALPPPSLDNRPSFIDGLDPDDHSAAANAARERVQERKNRAAGGYSQRPDVSDEPSPSGADKLYGQEDRNPQTSDDLVDQDQADDAFRLAERQRQRAQDNPDTADTQAGGRPGGRGTQAVFMDEDFPVEILDRRLVPDDKGQMTEVAKVRRYDPRTGQADEGAVEYDVPVRQLKKKAYMAEPRMGEDFSDRAASPGSAKRPGPEQPNTGPAEQGGPRAPSDQRQTYRTTPPDPDEGHFPGAGSGPDDGGSGGPYSGRSPFPEQPDGPHPGPERPSTEDDVIRDYERRQQEGPSPETDTRRTYAEDEVSNRVAPIGDDGHFEVDEDGYVRSHKGGPVRWTQKQRGMAAKKLLQMQAESPNQTFELANHPGGGEYLTIKERERRGAPPPPPAGQSLVPVGKGPNVPPGFKVVEPVTPVKPPTDLMQHLSDVGIKGDDPGLKELTNLDVIKDYHKGKSFSKRIIRPDGKPLHQVLQGLEEAGFVGRAGEEGHITENLGLLDDALAAHKKGNQSFAGEDAHAGAAAQENNRFNDENRNQLEQAAGERNIDTTDMPDHEVEAAIAEHDARQRQQSAQTPQEHATVSQEIDDEISRHIDRAFNLEDDFEEAAPPRRGAGGSGRERAPDGTEGSAAEPAGHRQPSGVPELGESEGGAAGRSDGHPAERQQPDTADRNIAGVREGEGRRGSGQLDIPGAEPSARQAAQAREANDRGKIRSKTPQKEADDGMFAPPADRAQSSLLDEPPARGTEARREPLASEETPARDAEPAPKKPEVDPEYTARRAKIEAEHQEYMKKWRAEEAARQEYERTRPRTKEEIVARMKRVKEAADRRRKLALEFAAIREKHRERMNDIYREFEERAAKRDAEFKERQARYETDPEYRAQRDKEAHEYFERKRQERAREEKARPRQEEPVNDANASAHAEPVEGRFRTDKDKSVVSDKGNPIKFRSQKEAARWVIDTGHKESADQVFEVGNHPSGKGFTVRQREQILPEHLSDAAAGTRENPGTVRQARDMVDTKPTDGQKEAGNYQKGHTEVHGMPISIETPKGEARTGVDANGKRWSVDMPGDYGYFKGSKGADGEHIDVTVGANHKSEKAFIVDQFDPRTGKFDEHKVILGVDDAAAARDLYDRSFSDGSGPKRRAAVTEVSVDDLKNWLDGGTRKDPYNPRAGHTPKELLADLRHRLDAAGLADVSGKLLDDITGARIGGRSTVGTDAAGRISSLVEISKRLTDAGGRAHTIGHEILHIMRGLGLISDGEWAILSRASKANDWHAKYDIAKRYGDKDLETQIEEAIAEAGGTHYAGDKPFRGPVARVFDRIRNIIEAIGNWARGYGFKTSDDVFNAIYSGEIGRRPRGPIAEPHVAEQRAPMTDEDLRNRSIAAAAKRADSPLARVADAYTRQAKKILYDPWMKKVGWRFDALGNLPWKQDYMVKRYLALGKIANVDDTISRIYDSMKGASPEQAKSIYKFLTTKGAKVTDLPDAYRTAAVDVKKRIDQIGRTLVARGMLDEETYAKNAGEYLPRVYLKHVLGEGNMSALGSGKLPSDMGYLKKRKDIDEETRMLVLGEIQDPAFLGAMGVGKPQRDIAVLDFLHDISANKDWALPQSLVEWRGKPVSAVWLKGEAKRMAEMASYLDDSHGANATSRRDEALGLAREMGRTADGVLSTMGEVPADYRQVPATPRYGALGGMYIRKEIFNDITGGARLLPRDANWVESILSAGGVGTRLTQMWKMSKVALNPPSQVRNIVSNAALLQLSGVPMLKVPGMLMRALTEMKTDGAYWKIAKKYGVKATTFTSAELSTIHREMRDLKIREGGGWDQVYQLAAKLDALGAAKQAARKVGQIGGKITEAAGAAYGASEAIFKTARIIYGMEHLGEAEHTAALEAQDAVFDYSMVPRTVQALRQSPIGAPFITFGYKVAQKLLKTAALTPWRYAPYIALTAGMNEAFQYVNDVTDKDVEALRMALPKWLQEHNGVYVLPWKDSRGQWQAVDLGYFFPWQQMGEVASSTANGDVGGVIKSVGLFGSPLADIIVALKTGIDPFTDEPIMNKADAPAQRARDMMKYVWRMGAPTWLTDIGAAGKIYDSMMGTGTSRNGQPGMTPTQASMRGLGINVYPVDPTFTRAKNLRAMSFDISEAQKRRTQIARDRTLSQSQRVAAVKEQNDYIKSLRGQKRAYAEASQINPKLRAERPAD